MARTAPASFAWQRMEPSPLPAPRPCAVAVVGAGPVGLTLALDLGLRGHEVTVLNRLDHIAGGSKAICFGKRTLDIWDRLGVGEAIVRQGVAWNIGRIFAGPDAEPVTTFDMERGGRQKRPAFVNLPQYRAEKILLDALEALPNVDVRWRHEVIGIEVRDDEVRLDVAAAGGRYRMKAAWVAACDGSRSKVRELLGLDFAGHIFEDNFLIADIELDADRPAERWFWFDPPFNPGQSALLHKQPGRIWRLDFQLGRGIERDDWLKRERTEELVRNMIGSDAPFNLVWSSIYSFQCRRLDRFVHGRVLFAGDSAHLVSPFGARGCNGGVADADNLAWKLDLILRSEAPASLIESYDGEATVAADANICASSRSTEFITPATPASLALRNAVLQLARRHDFARALINTGRLSTAIAYPETSLGTRDEPGAAWGGIVPGSPPLDAPTREGWLLDALDRCGFTLISLMADLPDTIAGARHLRIEELGDPEGLVTARYDLRSGSAYLLRPDQYVAARWRAPTTGAIARALQTAKGFA